MGQTNSGMSANNSGGFGFSNDGTFGVLSASNSVPNVDGIGSKKFRHPWAVTFHLIFKLSSIIIYLFGSVFVQDFLGLFVTLIFLISIDFWIVKNITGRLLVGLRWWNYIDDEGQSHWVFENRSNLERKNPTSEPRNDPEFVLFNNDQPSTSTAVATTGSDATIFWISLFLYTLFWFFSFFSLIFSLNIHWVLLVAIALVLSGSNLYGYLRCRFGNNYNNYGSVISQYVGPKMLFNIMRNSASSAVSPTTVASSQPITPK